MSEKKTTLHILEEMAEDGIVEIVGETEDGEPIWDVTEYGRSLEVRTAFPAPDPLKAWEA